MQDKTGEEEELGEDNEGGKKGGNEGGNEGCNKEGMEDGNDENQVPGAEVCIFLYFPMLLAL